MSDRFGRIFLLSHMRAFTSLTGHVLGSHPEINGYYELHQSYEAASDLDHQRETLARQEGLKPGSRFLFDKLLHDAYRLLPERLAERDLKIIICLRRPAATLASIVRLFAGRKGYECYAQPEQAAAYYRARLATLARFAQEQAGRYGYFDADLWQVAPEALLAQLGLWLELSSPLREEYRLFSLTGQPGAGDSSPRIRSGRIERTLHDHAEVALPTPLLHEAQVAFDACRTVLVTHAAWVVLGG
ncbi:hypothetical protein [Thiobacter aerophilum]|uniref:Sulfotransferase family protein n=1 Tax=Thiobacter aerophilum TaxID=3121275 RepID=A0ABV0ED96_9BURK